MTSRHHIGVWSMLAVSTSLSLAGVVLALVRGGPVLDLSVFALSFIPGYVMAALLLVHQTRHPIGVVMSVLGLIVALQAFTEGYARTDGLSNELPVGGVVLIWLVSHSYIFIFVSIALLFYLFPSGRLLSRAWRIGIGFLSLGSLLSLSLYLKPGRMDDESAAGPENPLNPYALDVDPGVLDAVGGVAATFLLIGVALSLASLMLRFKRSRGIERVQMKWFAAAASCFAGVLAVNLIARNFFGLPVLLDILMSLAFTLIPISIGVAIMRYRLYEIDVFINRALVYGSLTACMAVIYGLLVVALQAAVPGGDSDLAIAGSTLLVAALIQPLRRRLQGFIDRRFYRRKYDARLTLADLARHLRDEVEIHAIRSDVLRAVEETVQPSHMALWLKTEPA